MTTIARWLKEILSKSGIDDSFTAHSSRHAASSQAKRSGVSIEVIRRTAGWSSNSTAFGRFYNREIRSDPDAFAKAVFDC